MGESSAEQTRWLVRAFWYGWAFLLAAAFPAVGYRLDQVSLNAPLSHEADRIMYNDAFLIMPMVQATLEGGTHWKTERLGFPGVQHTHDFPVIDHLHFLFLWILGQFAGSTVVTFNLYYLLTYPFAAMTMMAVARHFRISLPGALVVGVCYACLPYHQYRSQNHYFLSAYFMVPVTTLVILQVALGLLPFFRKDDRYVFTVRNRETWFAVAVMLVTSAAGAYYAFFACGLLAAAGLYGAVRQHSFKVLVSAGLLIGITVVAGVANHLPSFLYHQEFGHHPSPIARLPEESELYGLKITQLLMPIDDHKIRELAEYKSIYNSYMRPVQAPTERYSLGTVAALGFAGLLALLVLPLRTSPLVAAMASLTAMAVLIGTVGGFGAIFNQTITPAVRCYNRIAIYLAVFALLAVGLVGDRFTHWLKRLHWLPAKCALTYIAWGLLLWFALWDMTPIDWGTDWRWRVILSNQKRWDADEEFFRKIEANLNPDGHRPGPAVFQLPYIAWPEAAPLHQLGSYEHVRGYLHTSTIRWSFGAMKGREVDEWMKTVAVLPPLAAERMLDRLALAGFDGVLLDKRGYSPTLGHAIDISIRKAMPEATPIIHTDNGQVFFDLRQYRERIRPQRDWDRESYRETHPVSMLWLSGFISFAEPCYEWRKRFCAAAGEAILINPTEETRTITVSVRFSTEYPQPSTLQIQSGPWSETLTITSTSPAIRRTLTVPPGRHSIRFRCTLPESHIHSEPRRLTFEIDDFRLEQ